MGGEKAALNQPCFSYGKKSQLLGILVTHVDDLAGGVRQDYVQRAFQKSSKALVTTSRSLFSEAER